MSKKYKIFPFHGLPKYDTIGIFGLKISGNPDQFKFFQQQTGFLAKLILRV
jgi:hypothetical protein